ncbi:hypothetical protein C8Q77DRAFT_826235 [Trametes polyzona]|nr:hypothetical protein C8Q77DRAFT_826235 [Trametes polyzona]
MATNDAENPTSGSDAPDGYRYKYCQQMFTLGLGLPIPCPTTSFPVDAATGESAFDINIGTIAWVGSRGLTLPEYASERTPGEAQNDGLASLRQIAECQTFPPGVFWGATIERGSVGTLSRSRREPDDHVVGDYGFTLGTSTGSLLVTHRATRHYLPRTTRPTIIPMVVERLLEYSQVHERTVPSDCLTPGQARNHNELAFITGTVKTARFYVGHIVNLSDPTIPTRAALTVTVNAYGEYDCHITDCVEDMPHDGKTQSEYERELEEFEFTRLHSTTSKSGILSGPATLLMNAAIQDIPLGDISSGTIRDVDSRLGDSADAQPHTQGNDYDNEGEDSGFPGTDQYHTSAATSALDSASNAHGITRRPVIRWSCCNSAHPSDLHLAEDPPQATVFVHYYIIRIRNQSTPPQSAVAAAPMHCTVFDPVQVILSYILENAEDATIAVASDTDVLALFAESPEGVPADLPRGLGDTLTRLRPCIVVQEVGEHQIGSLKYTDYFEHLVFTAAE